MIRKIKRFERDSTIVLVDPVQDWTTWKTCAQSLIEPLGLEIIGAVLQNAGYKVKILQAQGKKPDFLVKEIIKYQPQVVGLTSYTYNFHDALKVAKKLKDQNRGIITIFGGYHATFVPSIIQDDAVDYVVRGPGELNMLELIKEIEKRGHLQNVKSIAYKDDKGEAHIKPINASLPNLDEIPFAIRYKEILEGCKIDSLMYPPPSQQRNTSAIFASRGCPFSCSYCTAPAYYGRRVQYRRPNKVVAEIEYLIKQYNTNTLYFVDLTFNLNRNYVIELCNEIIRKKLEIYWYALFRPERVDNMFANILKKAGCSKAGVGIESFDLNTIKKTKRGTARYFDNLKKTLKNLHEEGIITRGLVMIGYPWETHETYKNLINNLTSLPLDEIRIGILTPFPGTALYDQCGWEGRLLTANFMLYDSRNPRIKCDHVAPKDILNAGEIIYEKFYEADTYQKIKKYKISQNPLLESSFYEFERNFMKKKEVKK